MKEDILELESIVMAHILADVPVWTGNLSRHITGGGIGEIILSGPSYDIADAEKKVSKYGRGNARRLMTSWYDEKSGKRKKILARKPFIGVFTGTMKEFFDYAMLLNEYGAFGGGRHKHWTNRSVYNACNTYASVLKSKGYDAEVVPNIDLS